MDTPKASKRLQSNSGYEIDNSIVSQGNSFGESSFAAKDSRFSNVSMLGISPNKDTVKSIKSSRREKEIALKLFPWLEDISKLTRVCPDNIESRTVLNTMYFLIRFISFLNFVSRIMDIQLFS